MTPLRKRMVEDLQLKGYGERTQEMYVRAVRLLAQHYKKSPDLITEEELRDYFLYGKNVKKWARTTSTIAICGIKFFFEKTLKRDWTTLRFVRAKREKKLPAVLSRGEVRTVLGHVRLLRYRVCLATIYSCGLRLQEGTSLQVKDIDSARAMIHVHQGKGAKACPEPVEGIVMFLSLKEPWTYFESNGRATVILNGSSQRPVVAASTCPLPMNPCPGPVSKSSSNTL
jgi:integrase/recombinase XerD